MAWSLGVRVVAVLLAVGVVLTGLLFAVPNASAATVTWDTDADFNAGTINGLEVVGTGPSSTMILVQDATDWRNQNPISNPGAREGPAMAYDSMQNLVIMFGGYTTANQFDTWAYDPTLNTWANRNPSNHPSARAYSAMSFDAANGTMVLFGGVSDAGNEADTWEYHVEGNQWYETTPSTSPPAMGSYAMAYYASLQRHVLVGQSVVTGQMVTWAYDAATDAWLNRVASFNPPRSGHGLAYFGAQDRLVLLGGAVFNAYGDTWEYNYNANSWTNTVADGNGPPARSGMGLSYRSQDSAVWMYGGTSGNPMSDTWRYFDASGTRIWSSVPTQRAPPARHTFGITDMSTGKKSFVYGGILTGGGRASDTWSLGPAYRSQGTWDSANADALQSTVDWMTLTWSPTSQPSGTILRFQTASSVDSDGPWSFVGPNCAFNTYHTASGTAVCSTHDNKRYLRVRAYLLTTNNLNTPTMDWATVDYNAPAANPFIVATDPASAEFGVLETDPIIVQFSEAMDINSVTQTFSPNIAVTKEWSEGNSVLTYRHVDPLQECKAYTVTITGAQDTQGNPLAPGTAPNPWSFVTRCINPKISATDPTQGETDVLLTADIVITFSEPMDRATVSWIIDPDTQLSDAWSMGDTVLTLSHTENFPQCELHTVQISGKDLAGLALVPGVVPNPFQFQAQCTEPYIVSTSPYHLEVGVLETANIVVVFSEPMDIASVVPTISPLIGLSASWSNSDKTLTLSHATPFSPCKTYTAQIVSGKDLQGNNLVAGTVPNPWQFAIVCPNPFVVLTLPGDGELDVDRTMNITVQFSESVNPVTVAVTIVPGIFLTHTWDQTNQVLTVEHVEPFGCGLNTVEVVYAEDPDGNPLIDGPAPNPWTFTPICPNPYMLWTSPADGESGVPVTADIVVTFSEPMIPDTVRVDLRPPSVVLSQAWTGDDTILTLTHAAPFTPSTTYEVEITSGIGADGNPLVSGPAANPWQFRTVAVPPQILSTDPVDGTPNVDLPTTIVVIFSEAMDTVMTVASADPFVGLDHTWSDGDTVLTLTHGALFSECTEYTITVTGQDPEGDALVPGQVPNPWRFSTICVNPVIKDTNPADGAIEVALDAPVFVNFTRAMSIGTVQAAFSPLLATTSSWSNGDMSLRLSHSELFEPCTVYTVTITGKDAFGNNLAPGPVPNPWSFRTFCAAPFIVSTVPADGETDVPTSTSVVITFSRSMDQTTVTVEFLPGAGVSRTWSLGDTVLTLTVSPPLSQCTDYTVTVGGKSIEGKDLVPGLVPNPWSFQTVCAVPPPANLQVSKAPPNFVRLAWNTVPTADYYRVYESTNRFAAWPWTIIGTPNVPIFDAPHQTDGVTHYYVVRAVRSLAESPNSTMASKIQMFVGFNADTSNVRWLSLPYRSGYAKASDIANELGPGKVDVIGKWDAATQTSIVYVYFRGTWRGTDFSISAGDGLWVSSVSAFPWVIVGTDRSTSLQFSFNPPPLGNINWISLPFTSTYARASDIVLDIEGNTGPGANTKITEIAMWNAATQQFVRFYWTVGGWTGIDFTLAPGDAIYLRIVATFTWQPRLVTPEVP